MGRVHRAVHPWDVALFFFYFLLYLLNYLYVIYLYLTFIIPWHLAWSFFKAPCLRSTLCLLSSKPLPISA